MSLEVSLDGFSSPLLGCHADNHQDKYQTQTYNQSDHSADNVKIPWQFPRRFVALLPMLSVTHIMPVLVLLSVVG